MLNKARILALLIVLILTNCAKVSHQQESRVTKASLIAKRAKLLQRATTSDSVEVMQKSMLAAIQIDLDVRNLAQAKAALAGLSNIDVTMKDDLELLKAQFALYNNKPERALRHLGNIHHIALKQAEAQRNYYEIKAESCLKLKQPYKAALARVALGELLSDGLSRANNEKIFAILNELKLDELAMLLCEDKTTVSGWINLVYAIKRYSADQAELLAILRIWQDRFKEHPASELLGDLRGRGFTNPKRVALLLPSKGPYAKSAAAVKSGFFAAFYQVPTYARPKVSVINSYPSAIDAYKKALKIKADVVVGPLSKEEVADISSLGKLKVKVLALNSIGSNKVKNLYQFGLAPESEAAAIANKMWREGRSKPLLITPCNAWGKRMQSEFRRTWKRLSGPVVDYVEYDTKQYANAIKEGLHINASIKRFRKIRKLMQQKMGFEPRRRQDFDVIFLVATPDDARQLKPLLDFYYANKIPVFASSHIYSGVEDKLADADLNGITFCDMPWVLEDRKDILDIKRVTPLKFSNESNPRLVALGADAYRLIGKLDIFEHSPILGANGMTGMLKMDWRKNITRDLRWAKIENGQANFLHSK